MAARTGTPDVVELTADYEAWLGARIPVVAADLHGKHEQMAHSVLRFLRGTYYLWLHRLPRLVPELLAGPRVPAVGDLHVENFGTWRDHRGRRRWGVNDLDELAWCPYPLDLLRLATSAALVPDLPLSVRQLCRLVLRHWYEAPVGRAVNLDRAGTAHLARLVPAPASPRRYFTGLAGAPRAGPGALPGSVREAVLHTVPADGWQPTWHPRTAGTGSLGHPRFYGVGRDAAGRWHAREAKLLGPPTAAWAENRAATRAGDRAATRAGNPAGDPGLGGLPLVDDLLYGRVIAALYGPYPSRRVQGWQVRRLAPDVVRIDLSGLPPRDAGRVLRSMVTAMVAVHGVDGDHLRAAREHAAQRGDGWLHDAVAAMLEDVRASHRAWARYTGT